MTMKAKLDLAKSVLEAVEKDLIDPITGEFKKQPDWSDDVQLAADVESAYIAAGGHITSEVAKVLAGVAAVVKILGV